MVSPLIRRDWKSGVGVAGAVPNAVFSVNSAASHVARRRSAAQIELWPPSTCWKPAYWGLLATAARSLHNVRYSTDSDH